MEVNPEDDDPRPLDELMDEEDQEEALDDMEDYIESIAKANISPEQRNTYRNHLTRLGDLSSQYCSGREPGLTNEELMRCPQPNCCL